MPKIISGGYNLGKIKLTTRVNAFEKRNPSEFLRQLFIKEQLKAKKEKEERELLLKQKINKSRLVILYDTKLDDKDGLEYMKFITDETTNYSVIFYNGSEKIISAIEEQYNLGFRLFLSPTIDSNTLYYYCISLCEKYKDMLLISTNSTTYFENGTLPYNIIRTASNDKEMITYITDVLLYDLSYLTEDILPQYRYPISDTSYYYDNSGNVLEFQPPLFSKLVYVYTEQDSNGNLDFYSNNYLKELSEYITLTDITFKTFKIQHDDLTFSQELKDLLAENPVSDYNEFLTSSKTMFILNSSSPEKILSLLDEEYMYDNYFIFSDVFLNKKYSSKYKFNYALIPSANYSFDGFKLAGIIPGIEGRYISPYIYSTSDIILKLLPYYTQHVNQNANLNSTSLIVSFIEKLKAIKFIINNNEWYEKKIFTYYVETTEGDETNTQYNRHIFYKYKFNPITSGNFTEDNDIIKLLSDDSTYVDVDPSNYFMNPISLTNFGWNSRNDVIFTAQDISLNTFIFNDKKNFKNWVDEIDKSVGGNRKDSTIYGNNNHTALIFEIWRSHDPNFKIIETDIEYDLVLDYTNEIIEHNINKTITINRDCFKNAGINGVILEDNYLETETDEIIIDENVTLNKSDLLYSKNKSVTYCIIKYFKGTKYINSFNGLSIPYYAPIIINVKINTSILLTRFKVDDFVTYTKNNTLGKIRSISNNYREILIDNYLQVNEIQDTHLYLIKDNTSFTTDYSELILNDASLIIDYTDWKVFKKNLFIRSTFMDSIINTDANQTNVLIYNTFLDKKYVSQAIKDNLSITFSTYNNWNLWKNKMENSKNNNNLQTEIFWEMYRSNKLTHLEQSIDVGLIMKSYRSQVYSINTNVEVTRKKYTDLNGTLESEENVIIPISFKTSDILPTDVIGKPIIYVEYFSGHEYSFNDEYTFDGINEKYLSPLVININIIPDIIVTEYKVNDYVVFYDNDTQTEKICKVLSVSTDNLLTEILIFDTIVNNNTFYIKNFNNDTLNVKQEQIYLYSLEYNYKIINLDEIANLISDKNINITNEEMIDLMIIADNNNLDKVLITEFFRVYNDNVVELIKNNYFITFTNNTIFNSWKEKLNEEYIKTNNHTPIFFELIRSHDIQIEPLSINIDYRLQMDYLKPSAYNILRTLNLTRKIFDSSLNNFVSNEAFTMDLNFTTQTILPSNISSNIIYVQYFKGNKYLQYNELVNYYSPLIVEVNIIPIYITDGMEKNEFVVYNQKIYRITNFSENFENVYLQLYSIVEMSTTKIYIKEGTETQLTLSLLNNNNILPYIKGNPQELIDITEWGVFKINNIITPSDNIVSTIVVPDTSTKIITNLDDFNLNKNVFSGIKSDFTITMQNENILIDFKKFINASITFDRVNHSQLFFEIWRSHEFLLPLTIQIDYSLQMTPEQSKYKIIKTIPFTRNIYSTINNNNIDSTENDSLDIHIETPLITPSDILNVPLIVVKYFKGHKYIQNFTNISEAYYSPVLVKINITSYLKNPNFILTA
jgi:hypothetical protein